MFPGLHKSLELLTPRERLAWLGLVPLAVATAAVEAGAAALVFALVAALDGDASALARFGDARPLPTLFATAMVVFAARSLFLMAGVWARHRVVDGSSRELTRRVLARYLRAPYPFHLERGSASLVHRIVDAADTVTRRYLMSIVALTTELLVVVGLVALLVRVAPAASVAVAAACAVVVGALVRRSAPLFARWGREQADARARIVSLLQQGFGGIKEVKLAGKERFFDDAFAAQQRPASRLQFVETTVSESVRVGVETVAVLGLLAIGLALASGGAAGRALPLLGLFAYAAFRIIPSANRVLLHANLLRFGRAAVDDVHADWRALEGADAAAAPEAPGEPLRDAIAFEGVSFAYPGRPPVLTGVTLRVGRGEAVGVVGATGAGKTTLADLLLGLLAPTAGRVAVDGRDVQADVRAWQRRVGYVPQQPFLLDDTLRRNVAFGVEAGAIDEARVVAALEAAQLALPLDTPVGERGARLSGGERQRVAIARALHRAPDVLVLDEATAGLDPGTERALLAALDGLRGKLTLVVIAHRPSTMRWCDRLLYLSGGAVAATGTFAELAAANEGFRALTQAEP